MSRLGNKVMAAGAGAFLLCALPVVLLGGAGNPPSLCTPTTPTAAVSGDGWVATAYGPPWGGIQGDGVTATGLNLTAGQPAYEIAVDPSVIALGSFEHVTPNPFNTDHAFYAGDTGGAILGEHVDIYDWQGRAAQDAWGERQVQVTPAPDPGTGNLLSEITPTSASAGTSTSASEGCQSTSGPLGLTNGPTAQILPDGQAEAPAGAPAAVKLAIAAANQIVGKPYLWGGGHGQPLSEIAAGYDCSGSTSYVLHGAGLFGDYADVAAQFETFGQAGPGSWITVYANSAHVFLEIAGIVLDTAHYTTTSPAGTGPRWQPASMIAAQYAGDQANGNGGFVQRHPEGY
jgi:3D (Asp-Asp-Asp) domain-containing protein